jgi:hypothetical protein
MYDHKEFETLKGTTLTEVKRGDDEITIACADGRTFRMYHEQDCCENVWVEDICGDLADLLGSPLLRAEERSEQGESDGGSQTWTFYEMATIKGSVTIRWCGESNGYYSESVSLLQTT